MCPPSHVPSLPKSDAVSQTSVRQLHCRECPPSHATRPTIRAKEKKECHQKHLRHQRTVLHKFMHRVSPRSHTDVQLLLPLMEARSLRQHCVRQTGTAFVELKSVTRCCPLFVGAFPTSERDDSDPLHVKSKVYGQCRMCLRENHEIIF